MKTLTLFLFIAFIACSGTTSDKGQSSIKAYLKSNLKNPGMYEPLTFSKLDTLERADTSDTKQVSLYTMSHNYSINNADNQKVKMSLRFYLDKDLKVNLTDTKSINGDYGSLTGNAYWKYNDYVGNKPDAGSEITLWATDTIRTGLKYEAIADVHGNYKIEKILPGHYFIIVRSKNATDCPDWHLVQLKIYEDFIRRLFGFDIYDYAPQLHEIKKLEDAARIALNDESLSSFQKLDKYNSFEADMMDKAAELIKSFPEEFRMKIKLYAGYSNAYNFTGAQIEEGETKNIVSDFGITCI